MLIFFIVLGGIVLLLLIPSLILRKIYVPKDQYLDQKKHKTETKEVQIQSGDHTLYAQIIKPCDAETNLPIVICSHGFNSSFTKCKTMVANTLAKSGYGAICFDFYNGSKHSKSGGSVLNMNIFEEKEDLRNVLEYALSLPYADKKNIFLLGESQGGVITSLLANEVADVINSIVLYYPAFCIVDDAKKKFPDGNIPEKVKVFGVEITKKYYENVLTFDFFEHASRFPNNVLILHGTGDKMVPYEYGEKASKAYPHATFIPLENEIHGFTAKGQEKAIVDVYRFLEENRR